jgi:hypothetical protein
MTFEYRSRSEHVGQDVGCSCAGWSGHRTLVSESRWFLSLVSEGPNGPSLVHECHNSRLSGGLRFYLKPTAHPDPSVPFACEAF